MILPRLRTTEISVRVLTRNRLCHAVRSGNRAPAIKHPPTGPTRTTPETAGLPAASIPVTVDHPEEAAGIKIEENLPKSMHHFGRFVFPGFVNLSLNTASTFLFIYVDFNVFIYAYAYIIKP